MDRVDWFNFEREDPRARRQTQSVRPGGMDPAHVAANRIADRLGVELEPREHNAAGMATHYAIGIGPAAVYAVLRHNTPSVRAGHGAVWGVGLFLMQDEGLNAIAGLSAKPSEYPWQAHVRGLVAHTVYGLMLETALRITDELREDRSGHEVADLSAPALTGNA